MRSSGSITEAGTRGEGSVALTSASEQRGLTRLSTGKVGFIAAFELWNEEQREAAGRVLREVKQHGLEAVRVAFGDVHGIVRGKTLSISSFESAMSNGLDCTPVGYAFDTALDIVFNPFVAGGGHDMAEMTGAGDILIVPDPTTFKVLPWTDGPTGWLLGDEYFKNGRPVPFSGRALLKRQLAELDSHGLAAILGIEVEWYLTRLVDPRLTTNGVGGFGVQATPPEVAPVNLGYQLNIEQFTDELDPILRTLRRHLESLALPLRSTEHEAGPGQLEFTFEPQPALEAADGMLLFRSAVKQICMRHGYHASFMSCPALQGFEASGWHLHQSLFDNETGKNAFMSVDPETAVSDLARNYVGGLIAHARGASVFTTPTINGYRRLSGQRFAMAPDRAVWSGDNRGTYIRVLAEPNEPSAHIENRAGEPAANPYLYAASQIAAGLDGVDRGLDPGPLTDDPHSDEAPALPTSLVEAVDALKDDAILRERMGSRLVDFVIKLKENEIRRYQAATVDLPEGDGDVPTEWEQWEYFRVY